MATEKERSILIGLAVACGLLLILAVVGNVSAKKQMRLVQEEMNLRMDLEKQLDIISRENDSSKKENDSLKKELSTLRDQLTKEKANSEALKGALVEQQRVSGDLRLELDKMTRLKETLEEDLKEALTPKPSEVTQEGITTQGVGQ